MKNFKRLKIGPCLILFASVVISCSPVNEPVYEELIYEEEDGRLATNGSYINEASEQLAAGNLELALINFRQAIVYEEELPLAWRGVGMIYFRQNELAQAREALEIALELGGEATPIIYNMLGVTAMRASDFQDAINFFDAGIEMFDLEESRVSFEDINLEEDGINTEVIQSMMANRILAHQRLANWGEARELARLHLELFPDDERVQREYEFLRTR
jgi:tetratricopeptide (TPR) repeat protein